MYSSGTTGLPKCMVHGAGGTLLQHLKEHQLHTDLRRDDRIFYFTTCGWMMWNWLVSSLATGATVVLFDGAPMTPRTVLVTWRAGAVTVPGTSAGHCAGGEEGPPPGAATISPLRAILPTGSPLAAHSYDYVYHDIKADPHREHQRRTDIVSCFALGNPVGPVRGELQTRGLGMAVDVRPRRSPARDGEGELVHPALSQHAGPILGDLTPPSTGRLFRVLPASGATVTGPPH
jgi:acetoacetyl-CoA synthetase